MIMSSTRNALTSEVLGICTLTLHYHKMRIHSLPPSLFLHSSLPLSSSIPPSTEGFTNTGGGDMLHQIPETLDFEMQGVG